MVLACVSTFPKTEGIFIQTVVLAGIFIFELIGPVLVKFAFKRSHELNGGEIKEEEKEEIVVKDSQNQETK